MAYYNTEEIRSRLGISTSAVRDKPLDRDLLEKIRRAGIQHLEIMENPMNPFREEDPETMQEIVLVCKDLGLSIVSFHTQSINYALGGEAQRREEVERSKRIIDHLISIGGKVWVTHIPIDEDQSKKSYCELAKYYEGQDISFLIENCPRERRLEDCVKWIDLIAHPQIAMVLDVGHERNAQNQYLMTVPGETTRIIKAIGRRLYHLHLHEVICGRDHYAPLSEGGELQWTEIFSALKEIDYRGIFMFEPVYDEQHSKDPIGQVGRVPELLLRAAG